MKNIFVILGLSLFAFALLFAVIGTTNAAQQSPPAPSDDDEDGKVETEGDSRTKPGDEEKDKDASETAASDEASNDEEELVESASDVKTRILFLEPAPTKPEIELQAGRPVKLLVGFGSTGANNYTVLAIDAAFRYPQDYSYYIQNHTVRMYKKDVEAGRYSTFEYSFFVHDTFGGRPFGLTVTVYYNNRENPTATYRSAAFNSTINVLEEEATFTSETFFLYLIMLAIFVLIGLIFYKFSNKLHGKKQRSRDRTRQQPVEMGTQGANDVDTDWIPKHVLDATKNAANGSGALRARGKKKRVTAAGVFETSDSEGHVSGDGRHSKGRASGHESGEAEAESD